MAPSCGATSHRSGLPDDGAATYAVSELSERSISARSETLDFPKFTRGKWINRDPIVIVTRQRA